MGFITVGMRPDFGVQFVGSIMVDTVYQVIREHSATGVPVYAFWSAVSAALGMGFSFAVALTNFTPKKSFAEHEAKNEKTMIEIFASLKRIEVAAAGSGQCHEERINAMESRVTRIENTLYP